MQAHFVAEPAAQSINQRLGTFDMNAGPDIGEFVELDDVTYTVVFRTSFSRRRSGPPLRRQPRRGVRQH